MWKNKAKTRGRLEDKVEKISKKVKQKEKGVENSGEKIRYFRINPDQYLNNRNSEKKAQIKWQRGYY